jgi:cell division septal protein FtsQ
VSIGSRPRPSAVRVRGGSRPRPRVPQERGPGLLERLVRSVRSGGFWWWCLAKLAGLGVLLVGLALLYHVATSRSYYASEVTVDGNRLLDAQEVVDAAAVSGVHILWVNSRQTAQRLRALPALESAEVRPIFPRRVAIQVVERTPYAQWQLANAGFLVDREGRVIGPAARRDSLTVVRENRGGTLQPGDEVPAEAVLAAVELSELLPAAWQPVSGAFDYAPDAGISVATRAGWRVRFGDNENLPWKIQTFQALAAEIERSGARVQLVDVRFPGRPYYR